MSPAPLAAPATPPVPPSRACAHAPGTAGGRVLGGCQAAAPLPRGCQPLLTPCWPFWGFARGFSGSHTWLKALPCAWQCPCCASRWVCGFQFVPGLGQTTTDFHELLVTVQWKAEIHFFTQSLAVEFWLLGPCAPRFVTGGVSRVEFSLVR